MAASQAWQLYVGRLLLGVGAGLELTISPVYIQETVRPNMRALCVCLPQVELGEPLHPALHCCAGDDGGGDRGLPGDGPQSRLELAQVLAAARGD